MAAEERSRDEDTDDPLNVYRDFIKDPAFAFIWKGGIRPAKTELVLGSQVIDRDDCFYFPVISYCDLNGKSTGEDSDEWKYGTLSYKRYCRSQYVRDVKNQKNHGSKWHVPKILYLQGRYANESVDPRNNKLPKCECGGDLLIDHREIIYCAKCSLVRDSLSRSLRPSGDEEAGFYFDAISKCAFLLVGCGDLPEAQFFRDCFVV